MALGDTPYSRLASMAAPAGITGLPIATQPATPFTLAAQQAAAGGVGGVGTAVPGAVGGVSTLPGMLGGAEAAGGLEAAGTAAGTAAAAGRFAPMFAEGGKFAAGSLGRAGLYGAAGQVGGMVARGAVGNQSGTKDDALVDAIKGAGMGAGVGSFFPGPGTAIGAVLGGIGGGLWGALRGGGSDQEGMAKEYTKQRDALSGILSRYNISADTRDNLMLQFQAGLLDAKTKGDVTAVADSLKGTLGQVLIADRAQQQQRRQRAAASAAASAFMAPMLQDQLSKSNLYAQQMSDAMATSAQGITNGPLRDSYIAAARQAPLDVATQNAYALQQTMLTPALYGMGVPQGTQVTGGNADLSAILAAQQMSPTGTVTGQ